MSSKIYTEREKFIPSSHFLPEINTYKRTDHTNQIYNSHSEM